MALRKLSLLFAVTAVSVIAISLVGAFYGVITVFPNLLAG